MLRLPGFAPALHKRWSKGTLQPRLTLWLELGEGGASITLAPASPPLSLALSGEDGAENPPAPILSGRGAGKRSGARTVASGRIGETWQGNSYP